MMHCFKHPNSKCTFILCDIQEIRTKMLSLKNNDELIYGLSKNYNSSVSQKTGKL